MAFYEANNSVLKIGASIVGEVRTATVAESVDAQEVQTINSQSKRFASAQVEGTFDIQMYYDVGDTAQEQLKINQTITGLALSPNGDTAGQPTLTFDGLITEVSIETSAGGIVEKNISGRVNGDIVQS